MKIKNRVRKKKTKNSLLKPKLRLPKANGYSVHLFILLYIVDVEQCMEIV